MSLGTEKIESIAESIKKLIIVTKKISADKKVDLNDLPTVVAFLPELGNILDSFKDLGDAWSEAKDIDVQEVVNLIVEINKKVKEIENA